MPFARRTLLLASTIALSAASLLVVTEPVSATAANSCLSGDLICATPQNISGFVTGSPERSWDENVSNFSPQVYSDSTAVNDRVNSIRTRFSLAGYTGICYYRDANYGVARSYIVWSQPGWYDNSSVDLSSARAVTSSCI